MTSTKVTRFAAFREFSQQLRAASIKSSSLDARILCCHAWGISHAQFISDGDGYLSDEQFANAQKMIDLRLTRVPIGYIVGRKDFWKRTFRVDESVLIPRPETETLIEVALALRAGGKIPSASPLFCDLGTGSGCIAISLLEQWHDAVAITIDVSACALTVAAQNARDAGVADRMLPLCSSWLQAIDAKFALIVANPPYIPTDDIPTLEPEVSVFEPSIALDGGELGLEPYRLICRSAANCLLDGGVLLFEVGEHQAQPVLEIAQLAGLTPLADTDILPISYAGAGVWRDLSQKSRVVALRR